MKILFEEFSYRTTTLEALLPRSYFQPIDQHFSKVIYVGYYNASPLSTNGEAVIILPKVFLNDEEKLFGIYNPAELLEDGGFSLSLLKRDKNYHIIYNISIWIFRAIQKYVERIPNTQIAANEKVNQIISNVGAADQTELGIVLSLLNFYKEHKLLFTTITNKSHSGANRINWRKTTSKVTPIIQGNIIIYPNVISKRKETDFEEELLVIFYSVLAHYKQLYGFELNLDSRYQLYDGFKFHRLLNNGASKLRSIKYKYFDDRFVKLWKLLYSFFEKAEQSTTNRQREELLVIRDFNIVFEDMIDAMISDDNLPHVLKNHKDGKELDHIYRDTSLFQGRSIYFIGDSKYYKPGTTIGTTSVHKQFTYAKNVIQFNIDLFNKGRLSDNIQYRDDLTEGYNITPNFFIQATLDKTFDFSKDNLVPKQSHPSFSRHFEDRLFDRDTLYVQHYEINFLFVLASYVTGTSSLRSRFRKLARQKFRENLLGYFNENYTFYEIRPHSLLESFVETHFKQLIGKIYRSTPDDAFVILAVKKTVSNDSDVKKLLNGEASFNRFLLQ